MLATFQALNGHMWIAAAIFNTADIQQSHLCKMLY